MIVCIFRCYNLLLMSGFGCGTNRECAETKLFHGAVQNLHPWLRLHGRAARTSPIYSREPLSRRHRCTLRWVCCSVLAKNVRSLRAVCTLCRLTGCGNWQLFCAHRSEAVSNTLSDRPRNSADESSPHPPNHSRRVSCQSKTLPTRQYPYQRASL